MRNRSSLTIRASGALAVSLACALLATTAPATAQSGVRDPAGVKQERDEVRRKLDALKKAINETSGEKKQAAKALGLLEKRLYSEHPPREEYLLTAAGRDFLPILFMIGEWGRQYRGDDNMIRFFDMEAGTEIKAIVVDEVTGAKIGTRPLRVVMPDEN